VVSLACVGLQLHRCSWRPTQAKDTTAAIQILNQFMAGHTLDPASLNSQVQTITQLTEQFGVSLRWRPPSIDVAVGDSCLKSGTMIVSATG